MNSSNFCRRAIVVASVLAVLPMQIAPTFAQKVPLSSSQVAALQSVESALSAGKLRASSQRAARLYLESGLELRVQRTQNALTTEVANVETSLAMLKKVTMKGDKEKRDLKRALDSLTEQWGELKPVLTSKYRTDKTQPVYDISEQMYIYASKITFLFEDVNNSEAGYMIDVAGRLQSTSERIAKAAIHGVTSGKSGSAVDFITWKKEYLEAYRELVGSPLNDESQTRNLELGGVMWGIFDNIITRATTKSDISQVIDISKCADGMWEIAQSSRTAYVVALKRSGSDKMIVRNNGKPS